MMSFESLAYAILIPPIIPRVAPPAVVDWNAVPHWLLYCYAIAVLLSGAACGALLSHLLFVAGRAIFRWFTETPDQKHRREWREVERL